MIISDDVGVGVALCVLVTEVSQGVRGELTGVLILGVGGFITGVG